MDQNTVIMTTPFSTVQECLAILVNKNRLEILANYCMIPATVPSQIGLKKKYKYLKPFQIYFSFKYIKPP